MSKYKVDISGIDTSHLTVLKNAEMKDLLRRYRDTNDLHLRDEMILGNLKLVLSMVSRYSRRTDNMDDLFQIGVVGLIKAIDNFNLELDVQFSTYAVPLIIGEIKRYLRDFSPIKISRTIRDHAYLIMNKKEEYINAYAKEPNNEELMALTGLSEKEINEAMSSLQCVQSIFEQPKGMENDNLNLIDQLFDKTKDMGDVLNKMALKDAIKKLDDKERWIINERYFLDKTQNEIAESLKVSQAQVSRLEKNVIFRLKELMS
ncbi:sigma-70 family RNA polymerase sigma factor [Beduini massiliensis]|uniref:sigma-70 family RNA polymerase sigma factor n=1 Tax=Beduini massiliensis TaxID=1585974 RepID=UPI00059AAD2A|nr:sigma-70 family RNA polymerase sigma factor [Beduini massiliensis]